MNSYTILEVEEAFLGLMPKAESRDQVTAIYNYKDMWYIRKSVMELQQTRKHMQFILPPKSYYS